MVPELAAGISSGAACASARENHVGDALRRFDIARGHRGRRLSAHHQLPLGAITSSGRITPAVYGISSRTRQRKHISGGRNRDRVVGVHRAFHLRIGAGEVDGGAIAMNGDGVAAIFTGRS
jgi:hypothetical protein